MNTFKNGLGWVDTAVLFYLALVAAVVFILKHAFLGQNFFCYTLNFSTFFVGQCAISLNIQASLTHKLKNILFWNT